VLNPKFTGHLQDQSSLIGGVQAFASTRTRRYHGLQDQPCYHQSKFTILGGN